MARFKYVIISFIVFIVACVLCFEIVYEKIAWDRKANRPMFGELFYTPEMEFFPRWHTYSPIYDKLGHNVFLDSHLNLMVIIMAPTNTFATIDTRQTTADRAIIDLNEHGDRYTILKHSDCLMIIDADGHERQLPLSAHQAEELYWIIQKSNFEDCLNWTLMQVKKQ
jgi:hypothetical protein